MISRYSMLDIYVSYSMIRYDTYTFQFTNKGLIMLGTPADYWRSLGLQPDRSIQQETFNA